MKPQRFTDTIKLLETNGFVCIRKGGHDIYAKGLVRVALPHHKMVSPGVMRSIHKAIARASTLPEGQKMETEEA